MSNRVEELLEYERIAMLAEYDRDRKIPHQGTKGGAREAILIKFLQKCIPARYGISSGHLISADNQWSKQQDVIIYDRLDSPLLEDLGASGRVVFVESALVAIEVKSTLSPSEIDDMNEKAKSVRSLVNSRRLFVPSNLSLGQIPEVLCFGFAFESPMRIQDIREHLRSQEEAGYLDMLCLLKDKDANAGFFITHQQSGIWILPDDGGESGAIALRRFLFEILSHLQRFSTVSLAPDLVEYLNVFGLDRLYRLQSLFDRFLKSDVSDHEIIEIVYLMGEIPGLMRDLILDEKSRFMFEREKFNGGTMNALVWTFLDESGVPQPLPARFAYESARKHHLRQEKSKADLSMLQAVVYWFRQMKSNNEKLVIKAP